MRNSKIPKWLKARGRSFSDRGHLEIDDLEEDGTALDTVPNKPPYKWRTYKQVKRRIAEMEELHEWIEDKAEKENLDSFLDTLENTLNSMT